MKVKPNLIVYENTPTLETERLILRKFREEDYQDLFEIMSDKEVNVYLPWFAYSEVNQAKEKIAQNISFYEKNTGYRYAVELKVNRKVIGYISLSDHESNDIGYGLHKQYWNKGFITEGVQAVVQRIKQAGYHFITATHDVNNVASGRVMEKIGMKYRYTYEEYWMPKEFYVNFRMYQLNFKENTATYKGYWDKYKVHFIEDIQ